MKGMKVLLLLSLAGVTWLIPLSHVSGGAAAKDPLRADMRLFQQIAAVHPVKRDDFLHSHLKGVVMGKGTVISVDSLKRYGMEYRVVMEEKEAPKYNMNIRYYLFMTAGQKKNLKPRKNESIEFQGILSAYTPLNAGRTGYILDVVLTHDGIRTD